MKYAKAIVKSVLGYMALTGLGLIYFVAEVTKCTKTQEKMQRLGGEVLNWMEK